MAPTLRDLARQLRDRRDTLEVKQMILLVRAHLEQAKERLVTVPPEDFPRTQGEAFAYKTLLSDLTKSDNIPLPAQRSPTGWHEI